MKRTLLSLCVLAALSAPAFGAEPTVEARLKALEARMQALEADAAAQKARADEATTALEATRAELEAIKSAPTPTESVAAAETSSASSGPSNPNLMNPAINIILNGEYAHHSLDPESYQRSGFPLAGEAGPGAQGLSLGESEISFAANIDDKFYGQLTLAVESEDGEDEIAIEEAYVDATALPGGFNLRAGRFLSNIGYLNNHHAHTDKFSDRPLPYQAFLGNHYGDDGLQLRWVAPTDTFIELSGELLRGQNFPSGGAAHSGVGVKTLSAHFGGDVGDEASWLAGVSALHSRTEGSDDGFTGDLRLLIADATWKWSPDGNTKDGGIQLRGEYFLEHRDGDYVDAEDPLLDQPWAGSRRGAYLEGVWRINRQWETGYRYDRLWADDEGPFASDYDPDRHSVMLTWRNSEFSLVRLQLSSDHPNPDDTDTAVTLQYQTNVGAHGAHKY